MWGKRKRQSFLNTRSYFSLLISLWNSNNFFRGCVSLSENFIWPTGYKTFKVSLYFPNRHGKMNHHNLCVCLKGRVQTWVVTCTCSQKSETPFVPLLYEFLLIGRKENGRVMNRTASWVTKTTSQRQWVREKKWFHNIICLYNSVFR